MFKSGDIVKVKGIKNLKDKIFTLDTFSEKENGWVIKCDGMNWTVHESYLVKVDK